MGDTKAAVQDDTVTAGETDVEDVVADTLADDKADETVEDKSADSEVKGEDDVKAKTDADKAKEDAKTEKVVEYNLKLPDGSVLPPSTIEEISTFAKENGLSNEAAQKLIDRENSKMSMFFAQKRESLKPIVEGWLKSAEKDPVIGGKDGSEFKANIGLAKRALDKANVPGLKEVLDKSGLGNHPDMIKFCMFWGKTLVNDKFEKGSAISKSKKSIEEKLYGGTSL